MEERDKTSSQAIQDALNSDTDIKVDDNISVEEDKNAGEKMLRGIAKKLDNLIGRIKSTFHGFFGVLIVLAVIAAAILYKTNNTGIITITLPVLKLSYLRVAIIIAIASLLGMLSTGKTKK